MGIDPLDMSPDTLMSRLINVGLQLARKVGVGIGLVNELRGLYEDVPIGTIGQAATTVGQGLNAAALANASHPSDQIPLDILPVVPSGFFTGNEAGRIIALSDVTFGSMDESDPNYTGGYRTWDVRVECGDWITFEDLMNCIDSYLETQREMFQEYGLNIGREKDRQTNLYFMGKRF